MLFNYIVQIYIHESHNQSQELGKESTKKGELNNYDQRHNNNNNNNNIS
jgi:hypothetical protein